MKKILITSLTGISLLAIAGCSGSSAESSTKNEQAAIAQNAAESIQFSENAEIENIQQRLELTSQPGLLGFTVLLNAAGQPIAYHSVEGKITSSGKRLTKPYEFVRKDCGGQWCDATVAAPSDEGTYGSSSPYVYFWTTSGQYVQWSGDYLYSDQPFRLRIQPLVINTTSEMTSQ